MSTKASTEESSQKVDVKIISIDPCILEKNDNQLSLCPLCRNKFDEVCNTCKNNHITDTSQCPVVEGKCGHKFHKHCIDSWLSFKSICPHPGCGCIWENS